VADSRSCERIECPGLGPFGVMRGVLQKSYSLSIGLWRELTLPIFYTPTHAEEILPEVKTIVQSVMGIKKDADDAKDDSEMAEAMKRLEVEIRKLEELGLVLKDMSLGLVDFPAVRLGERVCLCWKLGEDHVGFWHTLNEGYVGRKPVEEKEFYDDDLAIRSLNGEIVSKAYK